MPPRARRTERLVPDSQGLERAASLLRQGGLVAFPTETVYGLGADATRAEAVIGIYGAKERPRFNPLISHIASLEDALAEGDFGDDALKLARSFWPGPLTLVVPTSRTCSVSDLARAGLDSIGLRIPDHPIARELLKRVGRPVAAPSANRSGRVSPTAAEHVLGDLDGRIDAILDGGASPVGIESTIVACLDDTPRLLRPGGIPRAEIERVLGKSVSATQVDDTSPRAPGMLASHYAPRARVRLNAQDIKPGEAALLFGPESPRNLAQAAASMNLSPTGDLAEAATRLFGSLRQLDRAEVEMIAVSPIPNHGLGEAINDRLQRAAAER